MNISIIGTGYVGLVTGSCLASQGNHVMCCDIDREKINNLKKGILPIYEPGLSELAGYCMNTSNSLCFSSDIAEAVNYSDIIFVTVNTPTLEDSSCDLKYVFRAAREIARHMTCYKLIVHKSTVPVGTGHKVKSIVGNILKESGKNIVFDVAANPEFLKEGTALSDFASPDRIVIGAENAGPVKVLEEIYNAQIQAGVPVLETDIETAEMIKYASNAFLAARISFINEIANICELCGADAPTVARGMGLDTRIGPKYLCPGPGFGGSCFPKDVSALTGIGREHGYDPLFIRSILEMNTRQKDIMLKKIEAAAGPLENSVISILGISFKPDTDDIRESPAISIIGGLLAKKAIVKVYDPQAMDNMGKLYPEYFVLYYDNAYSACKNSDCIALLTDWKEFSNLDFNVLKTLVKKPVFLDLRNVYEPGYVKGFGFHYEGVGRK